jgi:ribosome-binding factor A
MPTVRQRQVAELIHRELSSLLLYEARDPRLSGVTITEVEVTRDLLLARVYFTLLDDEEEGAKEALGGFAHAKGFLRSQLADRLELRFVPDLAFFQDRSAAYGRRIDALLDELQESGALGDESDSE